MCSRSQLGAIWFATWLAAALAACSVNPVTFTSGGDGQRAENCNAAGDEDGNGLADCSDPACAAAPACRATCGNGKPEGSEACDDGNAINGDTCDTNCTRPGCGNSAVDPGEACDDGNAADGDGCDTNCTRTACGNSVKSAGEACDDGNTVNGDGCEATCKVTGTGSYEAIADAMIRTDNATSDASTNFGTQPDLVTYGSSFGTVARSLLAFDLTALPARTPIQSAFLSVRMVGQVGVEFSIDVREVLAPWLETAVTWDSQPAFSETRESGLLYQGYTTWRFDVTDLVQRWVDTPGENNGLVLTQNPELFESGGQFARFDSREGTARPVLDIIVAPP